MNALFDLSGRVALVTGASSGLGARFATVLAGAGAAVALAARRADRLDKLAGEIEAAGGRAMAVALDVTDSASITAAFEAVEAQFGVVDILVNNSGVAVSKLLDERDEADFDHVIGVNLKGAWLVASEAARRLVAAERAGSLINIASIVGVMRNTIRSHEYAASKAALAQFSRSLAVELAPQGIRVNTIAPGYIETDMTADFLATSAGERVIANVPQRRAGKPQDLDATILLLASDAASGFITGSVIVVDGGLSVAPV